MTPFQAPTPPDSRAIAFLPASPTPDRDSHFLGMIILASISIQKNTAKPAFCRSTAHSPIYSIFQKNCVRFHLTRFNPAPHSLDHS